MWEHLDIWLLLAGLGIFLFGIRLIEDSIAKLGGRGFKNLVREGTSTSLRAILTGTLATAVLQSSSAVTLMVLAFVGAGIVGLVGGIGVVLGSNIGTTATSWIVATIGFKLDIEEMALPLIAIGGLILIFLGKSQRYHQVSHLLVGFGFLFLGLDHMKDSVAAFTDHIDPAMLVDATPVHFILLGLLLTAAMQSSSATVAILLTALYAGLFDLREGAFAIIGCNVGTTVTGFLGALGGAVVKKRLAWSHLAFNVIAALLALIAFPLYMRIILLFLGEAADPVMGLALFHTLFNLAGVLLVAPFNARFARLVERLVPENEERHTFYIGEIAPDVPEAAVAGIQKEVWGLIVRTLAHHLQLLEIEPSLVLPPDVLRDHERDLPADERYTMLKRIQAEILTYATAVEAREMNEQESRLLDRAVHSARLTLYAAKALKDVKANLDSFLDTGGILQRYHAQLRKRMIGTHMKLSRVLENMPEEERTVQLATILRQLEVDDEGAMHTVNEATRSGDLRSMDLSTALLVNRALVRSTHDLTLAVAELMLPADAFRTLEHVQEVEEALQKRPAPEASEGPGPIQPKPR